MNLFRRLRYRGRHRLPAGACWLHPESCPVLDDYEDTRVGSVGGAW